MLEFDVWVLVNRETGELVSDEHGFPLPLFHSRREAREGVIPEEEVVKKARISVEIDFTSKG